MNTIGDSLFAQFKSTRFVIVCLLTLVAFSLLINLGLWQLSRAKEKSLIEQQVNLRANIPAIGLDSLTAEQRLNPTGVSIELIAKPIMGRYLLLDNQSVEGRVGYLALQLVQSESGKNVLLERGFITAPERRSQLPEVVWLYEPLQMKGRLYRKSPNPLSHDLHLESGRVNRIQNLNFAQLQQYWNLELEPYVFQPQVELWPYEQPWQPVSMNSEKHIGYAVQWFSMAAVLALISILLLLRTLKQGEVDE